MQRTTVLYSSVLVVSSSSRPNPSELPRCGGGKDLVVTSYYTILGVEAAETGSKGTANSEDSRTAHVIGLNWQIVLDISLAPEISVLFIASLH